MALPTQNAEASSSRPPLPGASSSTNSFPSQSTTSLHSQSSSSRAQATSKALPSLPPLPPADRLPPPKGRSVHNPGHKFKLGKKSKPPRHERSSSVVSVDDDEDWALAGTGRTGGTSRTSTNGSIPTISTSRASSELLSPDDAGQAMDDSQLTEVPRNQKERKKSKGRGLVKKTSRLFMRGGDKDKDKEKSGDGASNGALTPDSASSLNLPGASRQTSHSSVTSGESRSTSATNGTTGTTGTTGTGRQHLSMLRRPMSAHSRGPNARRMSADSENSWHASGSARSGSTSTYDSPTDPHHLPVPTRHSSNLSASVPTLSRQALPQPSSGSTEPSHGLPSRMSTWFSHLIPSTSSTAPSSSTSAEPTAYAASPPRKGPSAAASLFNAARQKAVDGVRHLLDSEAQPDKCPDVMWVMGVGHPGYRSSTPLGSPGKDDNESMETLSDATTGSPVAAIATAPPRPSPSKNDAPNLRPSAWRKKDGAVATSSPAKGGLGSLFSGSAISLALPSSVSGGSPSKEGDVKPTPQESPGKIKKAKVEKEVLKWPEQFYDDFRSRIWCTYRSQYAPILSLPNNLLIPTPESYFSAFGPPLEASAPLPLAGMLGSGAAPSRPSSSPWVWARSEERGLTSDAGWGCMLRTGQSMLANALMHLHLGRDWRVPNDIPPIPATTQDEARTLETYASYVRILSWFLDDPSPLCPFSVHRMALIGKELGKEVGEWFGPSTAAGAIKTLANSFALAGLAVATATDSIVYKSDVYSASNLRSIGWDREEGSMSPVHSLLSSHKWGDRAVLILVGIRLGLDGVNPIYHDSIKALFTFPQSVGIAGGRPSSSYYFVASQANSLFYLDPHLTRPAVPLVVPPAPASRDGASPSKAPQGSVDVANESVAAAYTLDVVNVDEIPSESESDEPSSPSDRTRTSPAAKRLSAPSAHLPLHASRHPSTPPTHRRAPSDPFGETPSTTSSSKRHSESPLGPTGPPMVDPLSTWYASAYSKVQLDSFHCTKIKKMPLSGLDPSMLLGFLCRNEEEFDDFAHRVSKLPQKIFTIQDEPPTWDDDDDAGLESVSEPDPDVDDFAESLPSTRLSRDFDDEAEISGNMSPVTVSAVDLPARAAKLDLADPEDGLDRDLAPDGLDKQPDPPRITSPLTARPPKSTLPRSESEGWVKPERDLLNSLDTHEPAHHITKTAGLSQGQLGHQRSRTESDISLIAKPVTVFHQDAEEDVATPTLAQGTTQEEDTVVL